VQVVPPFGDVFGEVGDAVDDRHGMGSLARIVAIACNEREFKDNRGFDY
jgi:hypothetical protein